MSVYWSIITLKSTGAGNFTQRFEELDVRLKAKTPLFGKICIDLLLFAK